MARNDDVRILSRRIPARGVIPLTYSQVRHQVPAQRAEKRVFRSDLVFTRNRLSDVRPYLVSTRLDPMERYI